MNKIFSYISLISIVGVAHAEIAVVAKSSLQITGRVEGDVRMTTPASIGGKEAVTGRTLTPTTPTSDTRTPPAPGSTPGLEEEKPVVAIELPKIFLPRPRPGHRAVAVSGTGGDVGDWTSVRDFTLDKRSSPVVMPPGIYGEITLNDSTLVLGTPDSKGRSKYEFQRLALFGASQLVVQGPVTIICGEGLSLSGSVGSAAHPQWLDLRVSGGSVIVGPSVSIWGDLLAPASSISVGTKARITGMLVGDAVTIGAEAEIKAAAPSADRSAESVRFAPNSIAVQDGVARATDRMGGHFNASVTFLDDVPYILLTETPVPRDLQAHHRPKEALFEACCALFETSAFTAGRISVVRNAGDVQDSRRVNVAELNVSEAEFSRLIAKIGRQRARAENIARIRREPLLVNIFDQEMRSVLR